MKILDLTLPSPAANLALDEALLDWSEEQAHQGVLRFWQAREYFVVLGYGCKSAADVDLAACRADQIPVLRRPSGGGTVLQGPGCLSYALILPIDPGAGLGNLDQTNKTIMGRHRDALQPLLRQKVAQQGVTDLTADGLKFCGNAQRRKKKFLLFHGTFLLGLDLERISRYLTVPERQPAYRRGRPHAEFLTQIEIAPEEIKKTLQQAWGALDPLKNFPLEMAETMAKDKYSRDDWNLKF